MTTIEGKFKNGCGKSEFDYRFNTGCAMSGVMLHWSGVVIELFVLNADPLNNYIGAGLLGRGLITTNSKFCF